MQEREWSDALLEGAFGSTKCGPDLPCMAVLSAGMCVGACGCCAFFSVVQLWDTRVVIPRHASLSVATSFLICWGRAHGRLRCCCCCCHFLSTFEICLERSPLFSAVVYTTSLLTMNTSLEYLYCCKRSDAPSCELCITPAHSSLTPPAGEALCLAALIATSTLFWTSRIIVVVVDIRVSKGVGTTAVLTVSHSVLFPEHTSPTRYSTRRCCFSFPLACLLRQHS